MNVVSVLRSLTQSHHRLQSKTKIPKQSSYDRMINTENQQNVHNMSTETTERVTPGSLVIIWSLNHANTQVNSTKGAEDYHSGNRTAVLTRLSFSGRLSFSFQASPLPCFKLFCSDIVSIGAAIASIYADSMYFSCSISIARLSNAFFRYLYGL